MTNPIIFLDINGVLNQTSDTVEDCREPVLFPLGIGKIQNLQSLVTRADGRIVVSSSLRTKMKKNSVLCPVCRALHRFGLDINLIIGRTGDHGTRGELILKWVNEYHPSKWVVLDNKQHDFGNYPQISIRFVQINREEGLTEADTERALAILES